MKKLLSLIAVLVMVLSASSVFAYDFNWGYTGPVTFDFAGYTNGNTYDNGQSIPSQFDQVADAWGIGRVREIVKGHDAAGDTLWQMNNAGYELNYYYYGLVDTAVSAISTPGSDGLQILSKGGYFDFYLNPTGTFSAANAANFAGITSGTKFARIKLDPIVTGDGVTTMQQDYYYTDTGSGNAYGSLDLTGDWNTGWARAINSNYFFGSDISFDFTVTAATADGQNKGFSIQHSDPGYAVVTPEPISSTLFLLGGGALVAGRLRKKNRKS